MCKSRAEWSIDSLIQASSISSSVSGAGAETSRSVTGLQSFKHAPTLLNLLISSLGDFWPSKEPQAEYGYPLPMPPWSKMIVRLFYKAKATTVVIWSHIMLYPCDVHGVLDQIVHNQVWQFLHWCYYCGCKSTQMHECTVWIGISDWDSEKKLFIISDAPQAAQPCQSSSPVKDRNFAVAVLDWIQVT